MALALSVSAPVSAETATVTDVLDRQVEIPQQPERILLGFYFEDFFAVGGPKAYDRVVAISKGAWEGWRNLQWQAYTAAVPELLDLADVGEVDAGTFSLEAALAMQPDLALLAVWQVEALGDQVDRLEAAGVPVVTLDYNAQTVEKHVTSTHILGQVLGEETRAKELADAYAAAVADVQARVAGAKGDPRPVYVESGRGGAEVIGNSYGDLMWGGLIGMAGGDNIGKGKIAKWGPLSPEYVLSRDPHMILLTGSGWTKPPVAVRLGPSVAESVSWERMRPFLERPGWSELTAVKEGNVHGVYHGGTRTLYDYAFLQYIAKALYPEAFADVDPQESLDRFFERYMPIRFEGTYMTRLP
ncbi:MAG: ABC transporter substrate-binding protein [Pseudomonadota bacterium]